MERHFVPRETSGFRNLLPANIHSLPCRNRTKIQKYIYNLPSLGYESNSKYISCKMGRELCRHRTVGKSNTSTAWLESHKYDFQNIHSIYWSGTRGRLEVTVHSSHFLFMALYINYHKNISILLSIVYCKKTATVFWIWI